MDAPIALVRNATNTAQVAVWDYAADLMIVSAWTAGGDVEEVDRFNPADFAPEAELTRNGRRALAKETAATIFRELCG